MACSCVSYNHSAVCTAHSGNCSCVRVCTCHPVCDCDYVCTEFTVFNSSNCGVYSNYSGTDVLNNGKYMTCAVEPSDR